MQNLYSKEAALFLAELYSKNPYKIWNYYRAIKWYSKSNGINRKNFAIYLWDKFKIFLKLKPKKKVKTVFATVGKSFLYLFMFLMIRYGYYQIKFRYVFKAYRNMNYEKSDYDNIRLFSKSDYETEDIGSLQTIYNNMLLFYRKLDLISEIELKMIDMVLVYDDENSWLGDGNYGISYSQINTIMVKNLFHSDYVDEYGKNYPGITKEVYIHEIGHQIFSHGIEKHFAEYIDEDFQDSDYAYDNFNETISWFVEKIGFDKRNWDFRVYLNDLHWIGYNNYELEKYIENMDKYDYNHISIHTFAMLYYYMMKTYGLDSFTEYVRQALRTGDLKYALEEATGLEIKKLSGDYHRWVREMREKLMNRGEFYIYLDMPEI